MSSFFFSYNAPSPLQISICNCLPGLRSLCRCDMGISLIGATASIGGFRQPKRMAFHTNVRQRSMLSIPGYSWDLFGSMTRQEIIQRIAESLARWFMGYFST